MKIVIVGHGRAGKDTVAEFLRMLGFKYTHGTSWYGRQFVADHLGLPDADACWHERHKDRQLWKEIIDKNAEAVYKLCLEENNIITGLRRVRDVEWFKEHHKPLIIWVERDVPVDPTLEFGPEQAHIIINNNGTEEDMKWIVLRVLNIGLSTIITGIKDL